MPELSANLLIVLLTVVVSALGFSKPRVIEALILWPPAIDKRHEYYRLASYGVVHADLPHLAFNLITLYFFGGYVEQVYLQAYGQLAYVAFYVAALVASILPTYLTHRHDPRYRSLGASGAVSAVLFAFILFEPWRWIGVFFIPVPAIVFAALYIAYSVWAQRKGEDNVNHSAHLWGAAFGVAVTAVLVPGAARGFLERLLTFG